jgi:hypothetical protein
MDPDLGYVPSRSLKLLPGPGQSRAEERPLAGSRLVLGLSLGEEHGGEVE